MIFNINIEIVAAAVVVAWELADKSDDPIDWYTVEDNLGGIIDALFCAEGRLANEKFSYCCKLFDDIRFLIEIAKIRSKT